MEGAQMLESMDGGVTTDSGTVLCVCVRVSHHVILSEGNATTVSTVSTQGETCQACNGCPCPHTCVDIQVRAPKTSGHLVRQLMITIK